MQGMSHTYGKNLFFIAFDVNINDCWLNVPAAEKVVNDFNLEFVPYKEINTIIEEIDAERDKPSEVAVRRGITEPKLREGVVLRPLIEVIKNNGERVICKYKRLEFSERTKEPKVIDPDQLKKIADVKAIVDDWVTSVRLLHVLDKLPQDINIEQTSQVIKSMIEDIQREGEQEIEWSKQLSTEIGRKTAQLFKDYLKNKVYANS